MIPAPGSRRGAEDRATVEWWREWARVQLRGTVSRRRRAQRARAEAHDLRAVRRRDRGADDVVAGRDRAGSATGTTATAGCATRRSRCRRSTISATSTRPRPICRWLLHATRLTWPELQLMYDVYGEPVCRNANSIICAGFAGSRPGAHRQRARARQLQLDVYGEVLDAALPVHAAGRAPRPRDTRAWCAASARPSAAAGASRTKASGRRRGGRQHHTYSQGDVLGGARPARSSCTMQGTAYRARPLRRRREQIAHEIETRGFNEQSAAMSRVFDGRRCRCEPAAAPTLRLRRCAATRACAAHSRRSIAQLGRGGLVYRYLDAATGCLR